MAHTYKVEIRWLWFRLFPFENFCVKCAMLFGNDLFFNRLTSIARWALNFKNSSRTGKMWFSLSKCVPRSCLFLSNRGASLVRHFLQSAVSVSHYGLSSSDKKSERATLTRRTALLSAAATLQTFLLCFCFFLGAARVSPHVSHRSVFPKGLKSL